MAFKLAMLDGIVQGDTRKTNQSRWPFNLAFARFSLHSTEPTNHGEGRIRMWKWTKKKKTCKKFANWMSMCKQIGQNDSPCVCIDEEAFNKGVRVIKYIDLHLGLSLFVKLVPRAFILCSVIVSLAVLKKIVMLMKIVEDQLQTGMAHHWWCGLLVSKQAQVSVTSCRWSSCAVQQLSCTWKDTSSALARSSGFMVFLKTPIDHCIAPRKDKVLSPSSQCDV